jgi:hypothetical protein
MDGNASGATLLANASLINGSASGSAWANPEFILDETELDSGFGPILTATASLIPSGSAVANLEFILDETPLDGELSGAVLTVVASLIDGVASGIAGEPQVVGGWFRATRRLRIDGSAVGDVITSRVTLISGRATGSAVGQRVAIVRQLDLIAGAAGGNAVSGGVGLKIVALALERGAASGERNLTHEEIFILAEAA